MANQPTEYIILDLQGNELHRKPRNVRDYPEVGDKYEFETDDYEITTQIVAVDFRASTIKIFYGFVTYEVWVHRGIMALDSIDFHTMEPPELGSRLEVRGNSYLIHEVRSRTIIVIT